MYVTFISDNHKKSRSGHYSSMAKWNADPSEGLCALSGSHWNSGVNSWQTKLKKTLRPKKKNKVWPLEKKLKNSEAILESLSLQRYTTTLPLTILSLRENSFSDIKLFIPIESQKTCMYIGRYCIPKQSLSRNESKLLMTFLLFKFLWCLVWAVRVSRSEKQNHRCALWSESIV